MFPIFKLFVCFVIQCEPIRKNVLGRGNYGIFRNSPYLSKINSNFPEISILKIYRVEERILHIKLISKHPSYATKLHLEFELQQVKVCPFTVNLTLLTFM